MPFKIVRNNIADVKADAIVNTATPHPAAEDETDSALYGKAGMKQLLRAREAIGEIAVGEARETPAFDLKARYIIHTAGPVWKGGGQNEEALLHACYANALKLVNRLKCHSVAFPLISTGANGFPKDKAFEIAGSEIETFLLDHEIEVTLVVPDRDSMLLSRERMGEIQTFIEKNREENLLQEEYAKRLQSASAVQEEERCRLEEIYDRIPVPERKARFQEEPLDSDAGSQKQDRGLTESVDQDFIKRMRPFSPMEEEFSPGLFESAVILEDEDLSAPAAEEEPVCKNIASPALEEMEYFGSAETVPWKDKAALDDYLNDRDESFRECLFRMIDERGLDDATVYRKANVTRQLFSKIRCDETYIPSKQTIMALAISMRLDMGHMKELLEHAGFTISRSSRPDLIVSYYVNQNIYDLFEINAALFEYNEKLLGNL